MLSYEAVLDLNPTIARSGAIRMAGPLWMKENCSFSCIRTGSAVLLAPGNTLVDTGGELSRMAQKARFIMAILTQGCGFHEFATSVLVGLRPNRAEDDTADVSRGATVHRRPEAQTTIVRSPSTAPRTVE